MTSEPDRKPWWQTRGGLALVGFLSIAGFFLLTEHTAHVFGVLPYLLLLACPLLHFFMHSHHHGKGGLSELRQRHHHESMPDSTKRDAP